MAARDGDELARGEGQALRVIPKKGRKAGLAALVAVSLFLGAAAGSFLAMRVLRPQEARAYGLNNQGARNWTFAEGYTGPGFEEWILVFNPPGAFGSGKDVLVKMSLFGNEGFIGTYELPVLAPGQRYSVNINQVAEGFGYSGDVSVVAFSALEPDYAPFICERALYFDYKGRISGGSHLLGYQEGENGQ